MKKLLFVVGVVLVAISAEAPAQQSSKVTSLYCEVRLQSKGKTLTQYPFPVSNLKDGQKVRIGNEEIGAGVGIEVTYDESNGYPSIWLEETGRAGQRRLSVEGSVQHPLELTEVDSNGNLRSVSCQPALQ